MAKRPPIPKRTKEKLLLINNFACCMCGIYSKQNELQIHHIDGDNTNNNITNLAVLCTTPHHNLANIGLKKGDVGYGLKLTPNLIKKFKISWENKVAQERLPTIPQKPIRRIQKKRKKNISKIKVKHTKFYITEPVSEKVYQERNSISGIGCPPNHVVMLINQLYKKEFWLQLYYAVPDKNGNWTHNNCILKAFNEERYIYGIAIPSDKIGEVTSIFIDKPNLLIADDINKMKIKLEDKIGKIFITPPKKLIRIHESFIITRPVEEITTYENNTIVGIGCPSGYVVMIINELDKSVCWLQPGYAVSDKNGNWLHDKCRITKGENIKRNVFGIAVSSDKIELVRSIFLDEKKKYTVIKSSIEKVMDILKEKVGDILITPPKRLIRIS